MSFARRILIAALVVQILGFVREIVFAIGLERYVDTLTSLSDPTIVVATVVFVAVLVILRPIWSGNRWATLASVPIMVLLLLAVVPAFATLFVNPSPANFAVWFTVTLILAAALVGIPFAVVATLESFGRRAPTRAIAAARGFGGGVVFLATMAGSVVGMTVLGVAVAATPPPAGGAAIQGPPDETVMVTLRDLRFEPAPLHLAAGASTAVFVTNEDGFDHSFDVDELDIHTYVPAGRTVVIMLDSPSSTSLRLYCGIPGHAEAGMVADLEFE